MRTTGAERAATAVMGWLLKYGLGMSAHHFHRVQVSLQDLRLRVPAHAQPDERISADGEEPTATVGSGHECVPTFECPQERLLHEVVGVRLVPGQRECECCHTLDVRERRLFEPEHLPSVRIRKLRGVSITRAQPVRATGE